MLKKSLLKVFCLLIFVGCATGPKTKDITYESEGTTFKGHIAAPKDDGKKKPGILVVHEWWGHNEYAKKRAQMLADAGYVALALDMYGEGKTAGHPKEASQFSSAVFKNIPQAKKRFMAALETLKNHPQVDSDHIAAIGYCFGGGVVLTMARMGVPLDGVISYHGSMKSPVKAKKNKVKAKVLVFNGGADPMVTKDDIKNFKKEMESAHVDYKLVNFPGALHAFTNPKATKLGKEFNLPLAYDKLADEKSWNESLEFFQELF